MNRCVIFGDNQFISKHTFHISFKIPVSIDLLAHMLNGDDISLNTTNYSIFNMQDFRNWLWSSMLDLLWSGGIML